MASSSAMNSEVVGRKEAGAGGLLRPLITYALLSFLPPAKETTSNFKERDARAQASDPASAAASLQPGQRGRAKQSGRGRHATSPWQIPWAGWKDILWRTYGQIGDDRLLAVAAGVEPSTWRWLRAGASGSDGQKGNLQCHRRLPAAWSR